MVTVDQVKSYLLQIKQMRIRLEKAREEIQLLRQSDPVKAISYQYTGGKARRRRSATEKMVVDLVALEEAFYSLYDRYIDTRHEIIGQIDELFNVVADEDLPGLLFYRYAIILPFQEISEKLGDKCINYIYNKHKPALEAFGELHENTILEWLSEHE